MGIFGSNSASVDPVHKEVVQNHGGYTHESGKAVSDAQKGVGYTQPPAQQPGESWDHYCARKNSW